MIVLTRIVLKETVNNNVDDVLTARVEVISNNSPFQDYPHQGDKQDSLQAGLSKPGFNYENLVYQRS